MHIVDLVDEIADKLTELEEGQLADIYNQLAEWGLFPLKIKSAGEGQFTVLNGEDSE